MINKHLVKFIQKILKGAKEQYVYVQNGHLVVTDGKRLLVVDGLDRLEDGSYNLLIASDGMGSLMHADTKRGPDYTRVIPTNLLPGTIPLSYVHDNLSTFVAACISRLYSTDTEVYFADYGYVHDFTDYCRKIKQDCLLSLSEKAGYPFMLSFPDYQYVVMPMKYQHPRPAV